MYPALHWILPALLVTAVALWPAVHERSRLRTAIVLLSLAAAIWAASIFPAAWLPSLRAISEISLALVELAAAQIAIVAVFDLILRRVRIPKFVSEISVAASYVAVVFELLYRLGVNVTGIFATSAVAAAVVGLALQDMLGNIAGGIALELEGGILVGDYIEVDNVAGWVQHVRLRHTAITTQEGDTVILPNNQITRSAVRIWSKRHRQLVPFTMPYEINPHEVIDTVEFALRASPLRGIAANPAPLCVMQEMLAGHIRYAAVVWLDKPGHDTTEISAVLTRICFALRRAGIPALGISQAVDLTSPTENQSRNANPADILRRTPILRLLSEPDILEVASHLKHLSFAPGEHVITQGDAGDSMFFVVSGTVAISFRSSDGTESRISVIEPGNFFGEASLLTGEPRSASAVAMTAVDCYRLDKSGLQAVMNRDPALAEDMSVVMAHRQMELEVVREKIDRETAARREAENQNELLGRIRRFFSVTR
jgi:CRP-like cAMP-binding protein/small-conductance mechanosensitive channel